MPAPRRRKQPARASSSRCSTVSVASFLFVPMTPARAALDPAGAVDAGDRRAVASSTRPPSFGIVPRARRTAPRARRRRVADAPEDEPARDHLALLGRHGAHAAVAVGDERSARSRPPRPARRRESRRARRRKRSRSAAACRPARARRTRAGSRRSARDVRVALELRGARADRARARPGRRPRRRRPARRARCSSGVVNAACTGPRRPSIEDLADARSRRSPRSRDRSCPSGRAPPR